MVFGSTALKWTGCILFGLFFFMYALFGKVYEHAFMISTNRISELVYSQALAAVVSQSNYVVVSPLMRHYPSGDLLCFCGTEWFWL